MTFFFTLYTTLRHLSKVKIKKGVPETDFEILGSKLKNPKIRKKIPQKLGVNGRSPNFENKLGP